MPRTTFTADDPALPMNYPAFVFRTLRDDGHDPDALLAETGLTGEHLEDPNYRTGFWPLRRFVGNALTLTGDPHLGPRLALRFDPKFIGLPAYAAMNAACFRDALEVVERFFFLTFPALEFAFIDADPAFGQAAIRVRPKLALGDIDYFVFGSALVMCEGLCREMLGASRGAACAQAAIAKPHGWETIAPDVGFPVQFGAEETRLVLPAELLSRPLPGADPINHRRFVSLCEQFAAEAAFETTWASQVVAFLEAERNLGAPFSVAAAALGCSERGLRRRLARSGASYRTLVDQVRERRAREMLVNSARPIQAIAHELGFDAPSNFARSFKRWTGLTPKAFRDARQGRGEGGQN